jgi:hypothetical protein
MCTINYTSTILEITLFSLTLSASAEVDEAQDSEKEHQRQIGVNNEPSKPKREMGDKENLGLESPGGHVEHWPLSIKLVK